MATDQLIPPLTYTDDEIASFIPAGWSLVEGTARWDGDEQAFRFTVRDVSDLDWDVAVPLKAVAAQNRVPALRRAVDELERKRFKSFL
jgi:hypothetical protein